MSWLDYPIWDGITVESILAFTIFVVAATLVGRLISNLIRRNLDERVSRRTSKKVARFTFYVIVLAAVMIGSSKILDVDFSVLVISLGLVGVAIAFASQQIISNMLSGLLISISRPIQLEDWIEVGNGKVINYTQAGFVATSFDLWLDSDSSIETVRRIVSEEADRDPRVLPNVEGEEHKVTLKIFERPALRNLFGPAVDVITLNPRVNILDLKEGRVRINVRIWIKEINKRDEIVSGFLEALKGRFQGESVGLRDP
jgi:small conductance mechanosensitive channel